MIVELMDYNNVKSNHDIGDEKEIVAAHVKVISGDEVLEVLYKDGATKAFDSSDRRIHDFYDGGYLAFMPSAGVDLFRSEKWLGRINSYDWGEE